MKTYIIRRLLLMPLTLLGVTFLVFCITRFVPGGPIEQMMQQQSMSALSGQKAGSQRGDNNLSEADMERLEEQYSLQEPIITAVSYTHLIRAMRAFGLDLQKAVHEDMKAHFSKYPKLWGLKTTDRSIDHRRVPNLRAFFARKGWSVPITETAADYKPGDCLLYTSRCV